MSTPTDPRRPPETSVEKHLEDLETICALMTRYEEQSLVRPWVFVLWGVLVPVGSLVSAYLAGEGSGVPRILLSVWLPLLAVGGLSETFGWFQHSRRAGVALFTRRMNRLLAAYGGIIVIATILVVHMAPTGYSVGVILGIAALPLLAYAQMTYASLFFEAFGLLAVAIIGDIWLADTTTTLTASGVVAGLVYTVAGVHSGIAERRSGSQESAATDG